MRLISFIALLIVLANPAGAIDGKGGYGVYGVGNPSCGKWMAAKTTEAQGGDWHDRIYFMHWLGGYLTATNSHLRGKFDWAEGVDIHGLMAWIDNYCAVNPLDKVAKAARKLVIHLKSR